MRKDVVSFAVTGVAAVGLIAAIGLGFRILLDRSEAASGGGAEVQEAAPQAQPEPVPVPDAPEKCLAKPLSKWTPEEAEAYPLLREWLAGQSKRVLPWEWSDEALEKDPSGYCKAWIDLCRDEQSKLLAERAGAFFAAAKEGERKPDIASAMTRMAGIFDYYDNAAAAIESGAEDASSTGSIASSLRAAEEETFKALLQAIERR